MDAMQVVYDPSEVRYEKLLDTLFEHVDPTTKNRQGNDVGSQYRSAIYYHSAEQKSAAEKVLLLIIILNRKTYRHRSLMVLKCMLF